MESRVLSVRDIAYEIIPNTGYHPAFLTGTRRRMQMSMSANQLATLLDVMNIPAYSKVWAIVVEKNGNPVYVMKNLALSRTSLPYRRVLRVKLAEDNHLP
jgi:hypothetical protein